MTQANTLWQRYQQLKTERAAISMADAARELAITECELTAADPQAVWLRPDWPALLGALATLGPVRAAARNHACIHETTGDYANVTINGKIGLAINPKIDLRIFLFDWRYAFAANIDTTHGLEYGLLFFDRFGQAIQKVMLTLDSDRVAFGQLIDDFRINADSCRIDPPKAAAVEQPDSDIDGEAFQREWLSITDVHEFQPFLQRYGVSRRQAFRLAPAGQSWQVPVSAVAQMLQQAQSRQTPIMVFAGNKSIIQIHTGPLQQVQYDHGWLHVLDPAFTLHLDGAQIDQAWITHKPGDNGVVTSLELFDRQGNTLVTFFGERKPRQPEREDWVHLLKSLPTEERYAA